MKNKQVSLTAVSFQLTAGTWILLSTAMRKSTHTVEHNRMVTLHQMQHWSCRNCSYDTTINAVFASLWAVKAATQLLIYYTDIILN